MIEFQDKGEVLANFLGSYFYQHSELDFEDDISPIQKIKLTGDPRYIEILRERLIKLSQLGLAEDDLGETLLKLGAEHVPALEGSTRTWLARAIQILA